MKNEKSKKMMEIGPECSGAVWGRPRKVQGSSPWALGHPQLVLFSKGYGGSNARPGHFCMFGKFSAERFLGLKRFRPKIVKKKFCRNFFRPKTFSAKTFSAEKFSADNFFGQKIFGRKKIRLKISPSVSPKA